MKLSKAERESVRLKYDGLCAYCGELLPERWHADHLEPVVRDWYKSGAPASRPENDHLANMMPACPPCNIDKHSIRLEDWRGMIERSNDVLLRDNGTFRRAVRYGLVISKVRPVVFYFEFVNNLTLKATPKEPTK